MRYNGGDVSMGLTPSGEEAARSEESIMSHLISVSQLRLDQVDAVRSLAKVAPALTAVFLGLVVLFCVGFAQPLTIHNATHDSRHAIGFPCH
jgi:cobalt transporter subunit CbtB